MTFLAVCRNLSRSAWLRGGALWLILAVVASGLPRWEMHSHEAGGHGHSHAGGHDAHHDPAAPTADASESIVTHVHDGLYLSAALLFLERLSLRTDAPPAWLAAFKPAPPAAPAGPPPQRPPIV